SRDAGCSVSCAHWASSVDGPVTLRVTVRSCTHMYTLSLHDALPISRRLRRRVRPQGGTRKGPAGLFVQSGQPRTEPGEQTRRLRDRKSTRLNSSHVSISYAVFCLKKKTPPTALYTASAP